MIVRLNTALRNAILDAIFNGSAGVSFFNAGTVELRTGAPPASANSAAAGVVVATIVLPADAMGAAAGGSITKTASGWTDASADSTGTIGHARFKSNDTTLVMDVDVTEEGLGGAIEVSESSVILGQAFEITAFAVTMPSGE